MSAKLQIKYMRYLTHSVFHINKHTNTLNNLSNIRTGALFRKEESSLPLSCQSSSSYFVHSHSVSLKPKGHKVGTFEIKTLWSL